MRKYIKPSAIILALILSACSETKTAQQLILSGNNFVQVRDFSSAVIEFKNAIRLEPKNANARFSLGNAYLEQGDFINAEKEFSRSVELGLSFSDVAALMVKVKTHLDKADEVYQLVERSDDLSDSDYMEVLTYAGITSLKQRKVAQGQDYLSQALAINKNKVYSEIARAYIHYANRDFSQGLVVTNDLLKEEKEATEALLIQGHLYYALQEFEYASSAFARYLTYHPLDHKIRFLEVNSLIKAKKFEQANVLTDTLLLAFKDSPLALQFKAQLEYQKKNYSAARDYAELAIQHGEDYLGAKVIAGISSYLLGDVEQAYTKLNAISERVPNNLLVKRILAVTKFELGYYSDAVENFSSLEGDTTEDIQLLKSSSASLMGVGYVDNALTLINKAETFAPDNAQVAAQKGFMLLSQNDVDGINSIERAVELDPSLTHVQVALAIGYLNMGEDVKAQKIADLYKNNAEEADVGYVLEGFIYLKRKQSANAKVSFEKALSLNPKNIAGLYNLGLLHKRAAENSKAISYFDRVILLSPNHKGALKSLVSIAGNKASLKEVLPVLIKHHKNDSLYSTIALAQALRLDRRVEKAITMLETIDKSVVLTANYFMLLGDSYLELEKYQEANTIFAQGLAFEPKSYFLNIRYISTLEWLGDYRAALEQTRKLHQYYANNINITTSLIYLEVRNKNYNEAKRLLEAIKDQKNNQYLLDVIAGEIYSYEKNYSQAIEHYSAAYEKKPTELNLLNLARTLEFNKQNKEAEKLLESYLDKHVDNHKVRFLLAELYSVEDRKKRITQYQFLSTKIPDNAIVFNNLAWNQFKLEQTTEALINIEKAYQLQPSSMAIQESYGVILIENNKLTQGINILEKAILSGSTDYVAKEYLIKAKSLLNNQGKAQD
jgi:putative PEP-CTERM system TPR-repeat lipoprotein